MPLDAMDDAGLLAAYAAGDRDAAGVLAARLLPGAYAQAVRMLADKAAGVDEQLQFKDEKLARLEAELAELRARSGQKETVEVPVVPDEMVQNMAELAARAEAMADAAEERAAG